MAAIMQDDPPDLSESGRNIPVALDHVVRHCLEKDADNRFQTARDIVFALSEASGSTSTSSITSGAQAAAPAPGRRRAVIFAATGVLVAVVAGLLLWKRGGWRSGAEAGISEHSIAVLPFVNMSEDKANEYFSDGISEELLNLLAKIPQLQVTARTSSFSFKGKEIDDPGDRAHAARGARARRLGAQGGRQGAHHGAADRGRHRHAPVVADLRPQARRHLRDPGRDRGGRGQAAQGHAARRGAEGAHDRSARRTRCTCRPRQLGRQNTAEAFQQSDALFRQVLAIDPRYAPAWDGLAGNFINEADQGLLSNKEGYAQAREAAMKALAIDPEYAPAHASLGWIAMYGDNDLAGAAQHFKRALALDPADLDVLGNSATLLRVLGRLDEALALDEAVVRRDPVNVTRSSTWAPTSAGPAGSTRRSRRSAPC